MKTLRRNYEVKDRLSDLSDCVLLHILSFCYSKDAVRSCILSKRWKNLWKTLPTLILSHQPLEFEITDLDFTKFIPKILSLRDDSTTLHTLDFKSFGVMKPKLLKRILKYAFSHNTQQIRMDVKTCIQQFPPSFFSCHTLTSLELHFRFYQCTVFPNSLNFPALTNLSISNFVFSLNEDGRIDPFSTLNKLNNLKIINGIVSDHQSVCIISSATLAILSIQTDCSYSDMKFQLCTPSLSTFIYQGGIPLKELCGSMDNLSSVKHVTIDVSFDDNELLRYHRKTPSVLFNWFVELANIESLTVSPDTLKVLSLVRRRLLKAKFHSLYNLKSLKVITKTLASWIPKKIVDFLLQNSPSAKFYVDYDKSAHSTCIQLVMEYIYMD